MWTIYDVRLDLYWNEQVGDWGARHGATRYSAEERDERVLISIYHQWRHVDADHGHSEPAAERRIQWRSGAE